MCHALRLRFGLSATTIFSAESCYVQSRSMNTRCRRLSQVAIMCRVHIPNRWYVCLGPLCWQGWYNEFWGYNVDADTKYSPCSQYLCHLSPNVPFCSRIFEYSLTQLLVFIRFTKNWMWPRTCIYSYTGPWCEGHNNITCTTLLSNIDWKAKGITQLSWS